MLVLDEADKCWLGFKDELANILILPAKRQNILFSATLEMTLDSHNLF
jgi:superfamily II DNA/RNA helicase